MKTWTFILCILSVLSLFSCQKEAASITTENCTAAQVQDNSHPLAVELQALIDQYTAAGIPGVALVVTAENGGFFMGTAGYTDLASQYPLQACHSFRIASLTKTILATAIMQLVEQGTFGLQTPIKDLLPATTIGGLAKAEESTIAELLSHTSGIPNYDDNTRFVAHVLNEPGDELSVEDRLNYARTLEGTPDEVIRRFGQIYSNTNYILLELILEQATGQTYEDYIKDHIFTPLALNQATFSTLEPFPSELVSGYCDMFDNGKLREVNQFDARRWSGEASGIANALEVYHFFDSLLTGELCHSSLVDSMLMSHYGIQEETIAGQQALGHDGQAIGYSSEMWRLPSQQLTIVLLANQGRIVADQASIAPFEQLLADIVRLHE